MAAVVILDDTSGALTVALCPSGGGTGLSLVASLR